MKDAVVVDHRGAHKTTGATIWDRLVSMPSDAEFVRVVLDAGIMVWRRTLYPRHVDEGFWPGRIGMLFSAGDLGAEAASRLIAATATPEVGRHADAIAHSALVD